MEVILKYLSDRSVGQGINRRFTASIDNVEVKGIAYNHQLYNLSGDTSDACHWSIKLKFDLGIVKTHPKYKEIRVSLIDQILELTKEGIFSQAVVGPSAMKLRKKKR